MKIELKRNLVKMDFRKINRMLTISLFIIIICAMQVSAKIDMTIDMNQNYYVGDTVSFNYSITSDARVNMTYVANVNCPNAPAEMLDIKSTILSPGSPLREEYSYLKVTDSIEPQECTAYVEILSPIEKFVLRNFSIKTNPSFRFNVALDKIVFERKNNVNISFSSNVKNPSINATLIYPDKTVKQISMPYRFMADKIGVYELHVMASKQGYKTVSLDKKFAVIKEDVVVKDAFSGKVTSDAEGGYYILFQIGIIFVVILALGVAFYLWINKKKDDDKPKADDNEKNNDKPLT